MANTNQMDRKDNTALWTTWQLLVVAALAYTTYAAYHDRYNTQPTNAAESGGTMNDTRNQTTSNR